MPRRTIVVSLVFAFLCVSALSHAQIVAGAMFVRKRLHQIIKSDGTNKNAVDELAAELNLTPEQKERVRQIFSKTKEEIEGIVIRETEEINGLLDDEQKARFKEKRDKIEAEMKGQSAE